MAQIFEYFVVCGIGPEIRTLDNIKGFHGTEVMYLPSLLDQYPPPNHTLYPPPPPQLPTVSVIVTATVFWFCFSCFEFNFIVLFQCWEIWVVSGKCAFWQVVLPAGVEFYSSGFDSNDPSTFPKTYPIVLTGAFELSANLIHLFIRTYLNLIYMNFRF